MKMSRQIIYSSIFFVFLLTVTGMALASDINLEQVGHIGGCTNAVDVVGNYTYIGQGQYILIIDITNPSSPVSLSRIRTKGTVSEIKVSGHYAYVADWDKGLAIVDISNPSSPVLKGSYDTAGYAKGVSISGHYAYVADWDKGLVIVDISNPSSPILKGSYDTAGYAKGVSISGHYAYVADWDKGLTIVDISNPSSPILKGSYDTIGYAESVSVSGNYAYVADGYSGLAIVDISNPSSPVLKGSYDTTGCAFDVSVSGNYAYVADGYSGLTIVDISNPSSPVLKGSYDTAGCKSVIVTGNYAYLDNVNGLEIIDISNPSSPILKGSYDANYDTIEYAYGASVSGNYVYKADGYNGLVILKTNVVGQNDNTPPSNIMDLQSTTGTTWLNWTWTNPSDPDFNHTEIYLNGTFQTNTSAEYFNATDLQPETSYTLGTRTVDKYGNVNETWVNSTATTSKKTVSDVEKPVIQSVVLFPANTTAGSKINITVNATDNVGVAEVKAGDVSLIKESDGLWRGNMTASSSRGDYSLLVKANDTSNNTAETSAPYHVVQLSVGASIAPSPKISSVKAGSNVSVAIIVKNAQNIDDAFKVWISVSELPASSQANLTWFGWTEQNVKLRAGEEVTLPLKVNVPAGTAAGRKLFRVNVKSETTGISGFNTGYLTIT